MTGTFLVNKGSGDGWSRGGAGQRGLVSGAMNGDKKEMDSRASPVKIRSDNHRIYSLRYATLR